MGSCACDYVQTVLIFMAYMICDLASYTLSNRALQHSLWASGIYCGAMLCMAGFCHRRIWVVQESGAGQEQEQEWEQETQLEQEQKKEREQEQERGHEQEQEQDSSKVTVEIQTIIILKHFSSFAVFLAVILSFGGRDYCDELLAPHAGFLDAILAHNEGHASLVGPFWAHLYSGGSCLVSLAISGLVYYLLNFVGTDERKNKPGSPGSPLSDTIRDHAAKEEVHQAFASVIQRLCARLDAVDFRLTAALAAGSPWASLEVLKAHRVKLENLGRMNYALQSMTSTFQSLFSSSEEKEEKTQVKQEWKEHHFALHVYRKHIIESALSARDSAARSAAEAALQEQQESAQWSDDEADAAAGETKPEQEDDVPEIICDIAEESTLRGLAGFVQYCDPLLTPPVLAAGMVRSLLLVDEATRAKKLFEVVFARSRKAQTMVVAGSIPVDFLSVVKMHRVASVVLRRLLARYESLGRTDLCHLLDHVLLEDFREEKHCQDLVLNNPLVQDIVVYCRVSTRAVALKQPTAALVQGTSGDTDLLRLRKVGERLFAAVFVLHGGFLPLQEQGLTIPQEHSCVISDYVSVYTCVYVVLAPEVWPSRGSRLSSGMLLSIALTSWILLLVAAREEQEALLALDYRVFVVPMSRRWLPALCLIATGSLCFTRRPSVLPSPGRTPKLRTLRSRRRAGLSVHTNLDFDIEIPDEDLEMGLPIFLAASAALLGASQVKAAIDGPPEFQLKKGSLQGRTILITGASAGIGFESAVRLAEAGAALVVTARTAEKALAAERAVQREAESADVAGLPLDLSSLQSIRGFVEQCRDLPLLRTGFDVLVLNAGVMAVPRREATVDGIEMQLGVNHLGHFALAAQLLPLMREGSPTRIVSVSSLGHRLGDPQRLLQELEGQRSDYNAWAAYSDSKLANVIFAKELDRRLRAAGRRASAVSLHPGICATDLARFVVSGRDEPLEVTYSRFPAPVQAALQAMRGMLRPIRRGANCHVYLAAGADGGLDASGGTYFEDMKPAQCHAQADDPEIGTRLWEVSERLCGLRFDVASPKRLEEFGELAMITPVEVEAAQNAGTGDRFEKGKGSEVSPGPGSYDLPSTLDNKGAILDWAERFQEMSESGSPNPNNESFAREADSSLMATPTPRPATPRPSEKEKDSNTSCKL
eukprot:s980_g5.t1